MRLKFFFFAIAIGWLASFGVAAQSLEPVRTGTARIVPSYLFVSPNTKTGLTLDRAIGLLPSVDEQQLIGQERQLALCLDLRARIQPAIGNWREGSEPSSVIRERTSDAVLRYEGARMGSRWRQESVLLFRALGTGPHRMYVLRPRSKLGFRRMSAAMERSGIAFRTLVRGRSGRSVIYVVEMSHDLLPLARQAAREMRARLAVFSGEGEFFGHDNRDRSQEIFHAEIDEFERANPGVRDRCQ
jgi:hypothetical protein